MDKDKKLTRMMKFEIYSKDKKIYKILHELMFENRKIMNKTICAMYEWSDFKFEYKEKNKVYPKPVEFLTKKNGGFYKTAKGYIDYITREKYYKNNSRNSSSSVQNAVKLFQNKYKDMFKGLCTLPHYKKHNRVTLHNENIKLYKEKNNYYIDVSLLSNKYKNELKLVSGRFNFNMIVKDKSQRTILGRILTGQYSITESQIRCNEVKEKNDNDNNDKKDKKNKKFFLYLGYSFNQTKFVTGKNILGIDMGIKYAVYMALKDSENRWKITGGEIEAFRKQVEKRKYLIYQQRLVTKNRQRGRNKMLEPIVKIGDKIARFRDTTNHKYSKNIIHLAIKHDVGTIIMEDLTGINKKNLFLRNWSYYDLQQKIKYKADEVGIKVILINPAYTSQTCSHCGFVDKKNRKSQEDFKCLACGYEANADYNAALNIANYKI
jgi:putative transposase